MFRKNKTPNKISIIPSTEMQLGNFASFPNELMFYVLSFLNPKELCIVSKLSKVFYELANNNNLWRLFFKEGVGLGLEDTSYKAAFIVKPQLIRDEYAQFSLFAKMNRLGNLLAQLEANEIKFYNKKKTVLATYLKKQLEKIEKNKSPVLTLEIYGTLTELNQFFSILSKCKSIFSDGRPMHLFYSALLETFEKHGNSITLIKPECLRKINHYLQSAASLEQIKTLLNVLVTTDLARHAQLPDIIDLMIQRLNQSDAGPARASDLMALAATIKQQPTHKKGF